MSLRLPSVFLSKAKKDILNTVELATILKLSEFNENHPHATKFVRKYFLAAAMKAEFANPVAKVMIAVPLLGIGMVNPLPGDVSTALLLLASTRRQAKAFMREVIDEVDGTLEQRQFQDFVNAVTDKTTNPQNHLQLDAI